MNNEEQELESMLLSPDEAIKRRMEALQSQAGQQNIKMKPEIEDDSDDEFTKFKNNGDTAKIKYESMGRFSTPSILYFKGYSVEDISDLAVSKEEDILETMVAILSNLCTDKTVKIEEMTMEEFYETLIALKIRFNTRVHKHRWMHSCQNEVPSEDRQFSTSEIDLSTLEYKSILEAEEELKGYYRKKFDLMTDSEWETYISSKYKGTKTPSKEEEIESITIKEPINLIIDGNELEFRFPRIGDVIRGVKSAFKDFNAKTAKLKARQQPHGMPLEEWKEIKKEELEKYEKEKQKAAIINSRAMSLIKKNGKTLDFKERVDEFKKLPIGIMESLTNFFDSVKFGIQDERELTCDLCGSIEKRSLHRELSPIELLPTESTDPVKTGRKPGIVTTTIIYM